MKAQISILVLQELIRKTKCNNLVNSAVIRLENNTISTKGSGVEMAGKIDGRMSFNISYPCIVEEEGELPIKDITDLLSKTEIFEKEDLVAAEIAENKLVFSREIPKRILTYDLGDKKHIPTSYKGKTDIKFGVPTSVPETAPTLGEVIPLSIPKVVISNPSGKLQEIMFGAEAIMDSAQLKSFADAADKIKPLKIPMQIAGGRLNSAIKGTGTDLVSEIRTDKVEGEALSKYSVQILEIFKVGFGNATVRFGNDTAIHIHYQLDDQKSDYLLAAKTGIDAPPITPEKEKKK